MTPFCNSCCTFFAQITLQIPQVYSHINCLFEYRNFIEIIYRVLHNVNLTNFENLSQRNLRTNRVRECIFKKSGELNHEFFSLGTNYGSTFVSSVYVLVSQKRFSVFFVLRGSGLGLIFSMRLDGRKDI